MSKNESKILQQIEANYKMCRGAYGMLYYNIAENLKDYLASLDFVEIEALNKDIKVNDWGL